MDIDRIILMTFRVLFALGFIFQIVVGFWAIIWVTRIKQEHDIAMVTLNALVERAGLKAAVDKIQKTMPMKRRWDDTK